MCMKFYDDAKPLYHETDGSGVGLGAALLQTSEGYNMPQRHGARQHHTASYSICQ